MPTQEERLVTLEQATAEYRPVLQSVTYELTMVKGLIIDQTGITQKLRQDTDQIKKQLTDIEKKLDTLLELLNPS